MPDIYEAIWNSRGSHVSVSRRGSDGTWLDPQADVLLDEGAKAQSVTSAAALERPLFARVNESLFDQASFATFITLLDNYTAREGRPERSPDDPGVAPEIDAFLDAIMDTPPMELAFEHVQQTLDPALTRMAFRTQVRTIWFEPYTNRYQREEPFCVGFEHVFVGEEEDSDKVGGYHSWVKYYLDQRRELVTYLGHDYETEVAQLGLADPKVATVVMTWRSPVEDRGSGQVRLKKPGGFLVATRPECDIALGTVALLDVLAGRFEQPGNQEDHRRVQLGEYLNDLVLHPQTIQRNPQRNGPHIRTFYPKFRGDEAVIHDRGPGEPAAVPTQPHNSGALQIARALPNPLGTDDQGEWVELRNVSDATIELGNWRMTDGEGRLQALGGTIAGGDTRRIAITRLGTQAMLLGNDGGWILLFERNQRRAAVRYGRTGQDQIFEFD